MNEKIFLMANTKKTIVNKLNDALGIKLTEKQINLIFNDVDEFGEERRTGHTTAQIIRRLITEEFINIHVDMRPTSMPINQYNVYVQMLSDIRNKMLPTIECPSIVNINKSLYNQRFGGDNLCSKS